tara:strand:+ start:58459 stop:59718 length:1260 start_codon:yes stop_codon:yes gene_type:complete
MQDILESWKKNVQLVKWRRFKTAEKEFQNDFLDQKIHTLRSFFHKSDLDILTFRKNQIYDYDPSEFWLLYLVSQSNIASIELVFEICDVIEYYSKIDINYLRHKLLKSNGKIDKRSFRDKYFEVYLNYNLKQIGIQVDFEKCYRNEMNPDSEGMDSFFVFKSIPYTIECLKIKSWNEQFHSAAYKMLQVIVKTIRRNPRGLKILPITILAKPSEDLRNIDSDFKKIINEFIKHYNLKGIKEFKTTSRVFTDIILIANEDFEDVISKKKSLGNDYIKISTKFRNLKILDKEDNDIVLDIDRALTERYEFTIESRYNLTKPPHEFEDHLLKKIKKKIKQLKGLNILKKIIAIEFEAFEGFGNFPVNISYSFKKLNKLVDNEPNLIIILFYKNSKGTKLIKYKKSIYEENDQFMNYLLKRYI